MERITTHQVERMIFSLTRKHLSFNEPIPDFGTRYSNVLESCLAAPFITFAGKDLYPTDLKKMSALFYLMIKNHPFKNGNKRIAMTTLFYALAENKKWLKADIKVLYNFALWVAESPSDAKEEMMDYTEKFLKKHLIAY
ncbi:MAG: Fic family protein [Candidatus Omnitrophota bacterium]|nr:Fic family protein [Candidatus Omnitrophota bacterium]